MFKTFPEFSKLTLKDREEYEAFIKDLPPISDISLVKLLCWWNQLNSLAVAELEGNLVISYWMPGDEKNSGLSLVGTKNVDVAMCEILDNLKEKDEPVRLVHVPEFVVTSLRYPEQFIFTQERDYDECVVDLRNLYPLPKTKSSIQPEIRRSLARTATDRIKVKSLDLKSFVNRQILLEADRRWHRKGSLNDTLRDRHQAVQTAVTIAPTIGLENICLSIDGELQSFLLFKQPTDETYVQCYLFNLNYDIPGLLELMIYHYAKWFTERGFLYANIDSDLGLPMLRTFRLKLGPVNFFRKYTIEPAK